MVDRSVTPAAAVMPLTEKLSRPSWGRKAWQHFVRNPIALLGLLIVLAFVFIGLAAPLLAPYDPNAFSLRNSLKVPSPEHWLGTDFLGRDILSRLMYGTRISMFIGVAATFLGILIGVPLGAISGYYGGLIDMVIQRLVDMMFALPGILLALLLASMLGAGLANVVVAIGIGSIPLFIRLMRATVLSVRTQDYVLASYAMGARSFQILRWHVIPNSLGPVIVQATLNVAITIPAAAGLGFLGLGVSTNIPEWGVMLAEGRQYLFSAPHIAAAPSVAIILVAIGFNFLGEGLRELIDPLSGKSMM
ncbi:ABC transporter permease [Aggregatilineales bacterium SYSU G02658]